LLSLFLFINLSIYFHDCLLLINSRSEHKKGHFFAETEGCFKCFRHFVALLLFRVHKIETITHVEIAFRQLND